MRAVGGPGCSSTWSATSLDSWCPARGGTAGPSMPWMMSSAWWVVSSGSSWHSAGGDTGCPSTRWMSSSAWRVMSTGSSRRSAGCGATPVLTFSEGVHIHGGIGCTSNGHPLVLHPSNGMRNGSSCLGGVVVRMLSRCFVLRLLGCRRIFH
ncbi:uncharacterized protein LOC120353092 isoform X1 [Nilaparvata lugens]|uniref:uncharacterized protein LOC120353092 isoform X1 n=1 Tax=Nilaparvata lugens TaxID=108931 RepID=UPI00193CE8A8|nr:uncharacterized protein LOC120353092 isoform X1 [Nilaparvata lugens]XP_039291661.1 uncharacterized protein LOC120353092 isoform X1 [Nilaparvata lugens]